MLSHILAGQVWAVLCWGIVAVSGLVIVANSIIYQGRTGRTAGKYLVGLRTVSTTTGAPIGVLRALIRLGCLPADGILFLIGRFWPLHRDSDAHSPTTSPDQSSERTTRRVQPTVGADSA